MRILSFVIIVVGILLFLSPISNTLGYIPFVGGFLKSGTQLVFLIAAILVAIPVFIITLSIAWLYYNPRVGIVILGIGIILLAVLLIYNYVVSKNQYVVMAPSSSIYISRRPYLYY